MSRCTLVGLVFGLVACNGNGTSSNGDDGPSPDASEQSGTVTPRTGSWGYDNVTPVSSTCPSSINQAGNSNFAIDTSSEAGFHVIPGDGTAPFGCTLNGKAFECPDRAETTTDLRPAIDAVATAHAVANGSFSDATHASGRQEATVTCVGTQCAAAGAVFPCTVKVDFVIRAR